MELFQRLNAVKLLFYCVCILRMTEGWVRNNA